MCSLWVMKDTATRSLGQHKIWWFAISVPRTSIRRAQVSSACTNVMNAPATNFRLLPFVRLAFYASPSGFCSAKLTDQEEAAASKADI
jgi:hypothetical protein